MSTLEICKRYNTGFIDLVTNIGLCNKNIKADVEFINSNITYITEQHRNKPCDIYKIMNDIDYIKSIIDMFTETANKLYKMFKERYNRLDKRILNDIDYKNNLIERHKYGEMGFDSNTLRNIYLYKKNIINSENFAENNIMNFTNILLYNEPDVTPEYRYETFETVANIFRTIILNWEVNIPEADQIINGIKHNLFNFTYIVHDNVDTYFKNYEEIKRDLIDNDKTSVGVLNRMNKHEKYLHEHERNFNLGYNIASVPLYINDDIMSTKFNEIYDKNKSMHKNIEMKIDEVLKSIDDYKNKLEKIHNLFVNIFEFNEDIQKKISSLVGYLDNKFAGKPFLADNYVPEAIPVIYKKNKTKYFYI